MFSSLEKLREVRRKQLINVKAGFSSSDSMESLKIATGNFQEGMTSLKKQVEVMLQSAKHKEELIVLKMNQPPNNQQDKTMKQKDSEEDDSEEKRKLRRERKWNKYLYKKMFKLQ